LSVQVSSSSTLAQQTNSKIVEEATLPSSVNSTHDGSATAVPFTITQERDDARIVNPMLNASFQVRRGLGRGGHSQRKGTIVRAMSTVAKDYLDAAQVSSTGSSNR